MAAASMAGQASDLPTPPPERLAIPSRNPLPLSASQESQVRDIYYARVRKQCADEIKAFAACALGRTFTVSFACRAEHRAMNGCMKLHATQDEHDAAREEWFAMRMGARSIGRASDEDIFSAVAGRTEGMKSNGQ
ncbi:hypothetical protein NQ176_g6231 [Zarea fungicola]|uniref:Uncharacterized protein n=1 Tax=Zarea fungicola TaxID=93591 RepID=A0ACC1N6Q2_9HYPO|nr:hypothetical protein NQ176_g6231 [Lecanicillium fungicola]